MVLGVGRAIGEAMAVMMVAGNRGTLFFIHFFDRPFHFWWSRYAILLAYHSGEKSYVYQNPVCICFGSGAS